MKAFRLCQQICEKGLDTSRMTEFKHSSEKGLQGYFGDYSVTGKELEDGEHLLAIWGDENGDAQIEGVADVIITKSNTDKIYLYCIE